MLTTLANAIRWYGPLLTLSLVTPRLSVTLAPAKRWSCGWLDEAGMLVVCWAFITLEIEHGRKDS